MKNNTILRITIPILTDESAQLVIKVNAIIPKISSINAAPKIVFPAFVVSLPRLALEFPLLYLLMLLLKLHQ